ncbi:MAG: SMC-Scp complex subunit ScpB [Alphaproteobacteria bacterium]
MSDQSTRDQAQELRMLEAMLFAATEPLDEAALASHLPEGTDLAALLGELQAAYAERGINVVRVAKRWAMRTAVDLAPLLRRDVEVGRRLSRAGVETLSIIAYHQPVTRAEIEEMRGVSTSRGTLDILLEAGWIKPRGRRQTPGRPVTWVTTDGFLDHFGLDSLDDLTGVSDLRAAGLLDSGPSARGYGLELPLGGGGEDENDAEDADPVEPLSDQSDDD